MKLFKKVAFATAIALVMIVNTAKATTITQVHSFEGRSNLSPYNFSFDKFDPSLGELQSISTTLQARSSYYSWGEVLSSNGYPLTNLIGYLEVSQGDYYLNFDNIPNNNPLIIASSGYQGTLNANSSEYYHNEYLNDARNFNDLNILSSFTGDGTLDFYALSRMWLLEGGYNYHDVSSMGFFSGDFTLSYNYISTPVNPPAAVPVPPSILLFLTGLGLLGLTKRFRTAA